MASIKGTIAEIRFRNEENGYTIATVETDLEPFTVVGVFPPVGEGGFVSCEGSFVTHPKFGRQFKASEVRIERPDSLYGIIQFLGSGMIKGIGPKRASAIVTRFGESTLDVIENNPERLTKVSGISNRMAKEIASSYIEIKTVADAMSFLMSFGVTSGLSQKIVNEYGSDTVALVSSNPYRLIEDVRGIGFLTADRMAMKLGIDSRSDFRIRAGLIYTLLDNSEKNGNTFLPYKLLTEETARLLSLEESDELIEKNVNELVFAHKIKEFEYEGERAVMSAHLYNAEYSSAVKLCRMLEATNRALPDCSDEIAEFERIEGVTFHSEQKNAIVSALVNGVSVITGGPGTGKTTIVRCIMRILTTHNLSVKLMAPTGRASKRLSESTGADASTIHRALLSDEEDYAGLNSDAIIVDEFSMVDVSLLSELLSALRNDARLIIVGDSDQLPSVGAGNALADIIACGIIPVARLTRIYRQDERSKIIVNAHKVNDGEMPDLTGGNDFFFIRSQTALNTAQTTVDLITRRLSNYLNVEPARLQVLCPMKSGEAGCNNLNKLLRASLLGKPDKEVVVGEYSFASGDKVMHVVNNYNLEWTKNYATGKGVFNGDAGMVLEVRPDSGEIIVEFEDGRRVTYAGEDKTQLMPAYAITVHKSQGSEYEGVVIPISGGHPMIMTRNLLYTAITRAKSLVVLVGTEESIARMVHNNFIKQRYSMLRTFIVEAERKLSLLYAE